MSELKERLLAFLERKGGIATVARAIGKHPTLFYNVEKKGTVPNFETLVLIKDSFPDFDLNWVACGEAQQDGLTKIKMQPSELEKRLFSLERENEKLKIENEELKKEKAALYKILINSTNTGSVN